jgi:hypothetical protein
MKSQLALYAFAALIASALQASAAVEVAVSTDPVNCNQPFKVEAAFGAPTDNMRATFYVDGVEFASVNLNGPAEAQATFSGGDWDRLKPGNHRATVALYRKIELLDEGTADFSVAGWRCAEESTTSTTAAARPLVCRFNVDCLEPMTGVPQCAGANVTQAVRWAECKNPGTAEAACVPHEDQVVLAECRPGSICAGGACVEDPTWETTTSSTSSSTTTTTETSTTSTTETPTTTSSTTAPADSTTSTTHPVILQRTNTNLDRIIELLEGIILFFLPR